MNFSGFVVQLLNGLAGASSLFLVAAGLSLIFGVTRIVNFAHGSFYMVGVYIAYALVDRLEWLGFWLAVPIAALTVGVLGVIVEMTLLRRIYRAPELFQLLATFALEHSGTFYFCPAMVVSHGLFRITATKFNRT